MVKEVEKLIEIVGKGNLLEALFICMGSFQHDGERNDCSIDRRNHLGVSIFAKKARKNLSITTSILNLVYKVCF
ncbi:hypothetical protein [Wolbachia endosymbiont of Psylliodes chrysocephala]|uniref:hypothetical protein n=1 Tax=Wolbachia endosymbiont of Psylliodes chrysocephala TaxID=2883236 RepID=UPI0020A22566|nr:hypothetical protein [Wolbachia endosymbiont of Psylliodes chrysocephala]